MISWDEFFSSLKLYTDFFGVQFFSWAEIRDPQIRDPIKVFNLSGHACGEVSFFTSFLVMHVDQKTRVRKSTTNICTPRPECAPLQICRWRFVVRDYVLPDNGQKLRRWDEILYAADFWYKVARALTTWDWDLKTWDCRRFCPFRVAWHLAPSSGSGVLRPIRASSLYLKAL